MSRKTNVTSLRGAPGKAPAYVRTESKSTHGNRSFRRVWIPNRIGGSFESKRLMKMNHSPQLTHL
jgi:hypothetical protein